MSFLEPSPVFLAFIFAKNFVYPELLALLALARVIGASGPSRWLAALALAAALAGVATILAPALGMTGLPVYPRAARVMALGTGMMALLAMTAILALSAVVPGARWRWIDAVHGLALAGLLGLWVATWL
ncbi:hypothetical protein [Aestuariicoccus sp. MJ-SS9]|uniref:hypothetical protein n=1 Tax=Aestuariicoccus sp. MJ-SS9 TaxID=3079855 RepID=UPI0029079954|nr:hypothetical protein [Aestuariicoccus sp. MJ-SS9]MDU8911242.1 hypothetical protein [Aestuariicoccus sp. MJ-SS9]